MGLECGSTNIQSDVFARKIKFTYLSITYQAKEGSFTRVHGTNRCGLQVLVGLTHMSARISLSYYLVGVKSTL